MAQRQERRQHQRFDVAVRVHIAQLGEVDGALTSDVSEGGLFVRTSVAHAVGSCLPVRIIHAGTAEQIPTICEVVRQVTDGDGRVTGLGLRFIHLDEYLAARLREFVGAVATPPADEPASNVPVVPSDVLALAPLDSIPTPRHGAVPTGLTPVLVHILSLIDGQRSTEQLTRASGLSVAETLTALHDLNRAGIIDITLELSSTVVETTISLPEADAKSKRDFVEQKARDCLTEAVHAERADRIAEAVNLLEQALALKPTNAADIHIRLAKIAMGRLKNVGLARLHANKLREQFPDLDAGEHLQAEIDACERSLGAERDSARRIHQRAVATAEVSPRRRILGVIAGFAILGATSYLAWFFVLPHGARPRAVDTAELSRWLPLDGAQILNARLYLRIAAGWSDLNPTQKRKRLREVATWAKRAHGISDIIVANPIPVMVGRVVGGKVTVYE